MRLNLVGFENLRGLEIPEEHAYLLAVLAIRICFSPERAAYISTGCSPVIKSKNNHSSPGRAPYFVRINISPFQGYKKCGGVFVDGLHPSLIYTAPSGLEYIFRL